MNVEHPQSLRHVLPICEYSADDSRNNMRAAVFYDGSPCREDMEDVIHCRAVLLQVKVGERSEVGIVVNTSRRHHRHKPMPLTSSCSIRLYTADHSADGRSTFDRRVARVEFDKVHSLLLMYDTVKQQFDKIAFANESTNVIALLTLNNPIKCVYREPPQFEIGRYLLAGMFTGDLDFLAHFLGQQGASAKWLCMFCMAQQDQLHETFRLEGKAPMFPKRKGIHSLQNCYKIFKCGYLDLGHKLKTKARKEKVTR